MVSGFRGLRCVNQKEHFSFRLAHILTKVSISFLGIHQLKKQILREAYSAANSKTTRESSSSEKNCRELKKKQKVHDRRSSVRSCGEGPVPLRHPHGTISHKAEKFQLWFPSKGGKACFRGSLAVRCRGAVGARRGRWNLQGPGMGQTVGEIMHVGKEAGVKGSGNRQGGSVYSSK